ncbi:uncharacterized protein LOC112142174 [Oryzias melastigma]|uniref:uncharacterized protein LOC112142174 n=1 Tax=Oryzias melastigma TaxID=30732 RepID=UPI000CF7F919|nr:uncharacterized protein LOC112142174 [Oryzias melastigma]
MVKKRDHSAVIDSEDTRAADGALASGGHDYSRDPNAMESGDFEEEFPPLPLTPSKPPVPKKKPQNPALSNGDISTQLANLTKLINNRSDAIEDKIVGLNNKVDAVAKDLRGVTLKMAALEQRMDSLETPVKLLQKRMDDFESYSRKLNLKLVGVPETEKEDIRHVVIKICQMVLPSWKEKLVDAVDSIHRLGNRRQATNNTRPRAIILQFVSRVCRDAVWKAAKDSLYMKDHGLQFKEDFSKGDREKRQRLWPEIQKARAAGKVAYYAGARAFIQGEGEIIPGDQ